MHAFAGVPTRNSMHNNTVCKFHYRGGLMISAIRCGENIYISISIDYQPNELQNIGMLDIGKEPNIVHP